MMAAQVVVLHGPESVGKSVLAAQLAERLGGVMVPEYGRDYCLRHGTEISMRALAHIAGVQSQMIREAMAGALGPVIADTDALMTAVWADMMYERRSASLREPPVSGDLYLLCDTDLSFVDDGLRVYAAHEKRARFLSLCKAELERRDVPWAWVRGTGAARLDCALAAIAARLSVSAPR
jgi:nicotinamide riboside kinase